MSAGRVIGLDAHPDSFTVAALAGADAATAQIEWIDHHLGWKQLARWVERRLQPDDLIVMEASGNTFEMATRLQKLGCHVVVLESLRAGQVRKTYCNTDKVSAVKIARVYLSGLAVVVWQPDETTRARREIFHRYRRALTDAVRARNRIGSWLSDHGIRPRPGLRLTQPSGRHWILQCRDWTPTQCLLIGQMLDQLIHAHSQRRQLRQIMAQELTTDSQMLKLVRLLGIREITAFALMAFIGDIHRFRTPKQLVAYIGLNPRVNLSGKGGFTGSLAHSGRRDVRWCLIQAAQALLRTDNPLRSWGCKLVFRKSRNQAAVAVARKLLVSVWYLLHGRFSPLQEITESLRIKITKIVTAVGKSNVRAMGFTTSKEFARCLHQKLLAT
jgi:transposase